ncbi:MAG: flagellin [Nitrospirota bacterium]
MALVINTNLSSIRAQLNLNKTQSSLSTSLERISSGSRINSPKDDAAGLAISQRMSSQIEKLGKAIQNAQGGITFVQAAASALEGVSSILVEIQALTVQASGADKSATDRSVLSNQITKKREEIDRLAEDAEFNGRKMLTGKIVNAEFQVGLRSEQVMRMSIPLVATLNIGNYHTQTDNTREFAIGAAQQGVQIGVAPTNFVQEQKITIRGFSSGPAGAEIGIRAGEAAKSIAEKINAVEAQTGVTAVARSVVTLSNIFGNDVGGEGQKISFKLYGINAKVEDSGGGESSGGKENDPVSISAKITADTEEGLSDLISAINDKVSDTGIRARAVELTDADGQSTTGIVLENGGVDISIESFRNDRVASKSEETEDVLDKTTIDVRGIDGSLLVTLEEGGDTDSVTVGGIVTLNSFRAFTVASSAEAEASLFFSGFEGVSQTADFTSLSSIDVSTEEGVKEAVLVSTNALDFISSVRGDLGAIQNRFVSAVSNLETVRENTQTAQSRVLDTDFAQETAQLTRAQVLQQAGIAILAQANTIPQAVLALLRT